ncbi:MAG: peptide/nickel transport system substrate-binding protein [Chloroflexota bacterium]|jgi:peptide/nickel transport system substrate-binding protein|nr:peptide/nickel transport system substrate-binding protein [Chloroflexota bacterium]
MVLVTRGEPNSIAARPLRTTGSTFGIATRLVNADLVLVDQSGVPHPYLAESIPQLNTDTWKVLPDGRMETTYKLRPNLTWHDGAPLSAKDFVFAWRVYTTQNLGIASLRPQSLMEEVAAPDDRTVVIRWREIYLEADSLVGGSSGYQPLPEHILGGALAQGDPDAFVAQPYWTTEYVGLGPYRLSRWEPGAFIETTAFPGHALGRPKIDRARVIFVGDPNAALANMLAGSANWAGDEALDFQRAVTLKQQWDASNGGSVLLSPNELRYVQVQFKTEYTNPAAILDSRVRKALAHALDKQGLIDGILNGDGTYADTMIPNTLDYYPTVNSAIAKYPYDPRMTQQLMGEAGFTKDGDGWFASPTGGRFNPEFRTQTGGQAEQEMAIVVDGWRRAGVDARSFVLPAAQDQDLQARATFPSFASANSQLAEQTLLDKLVGSRAARADNRWTGSNRGGYANSAYDRLVEGFSRQLDRGQRDQVMVQLMKLISDELPIFPLYYNARVVAFTGLSGPQGRSPGSTDYGNVYEWEFSTAAPPTPARP